MKRFGNLFDKICDLNNLYLAYTSNEQYLKVTQEYEES